MPTATRGRQAVRQVQLRDRDQLRQLGRADDAARAEHRVVDRVAPASAPVCAAARRAPTSERPTLIGAMGLPTSRARSHTAGKSAGLRIDSTNDSTMRISGSCSA